MGDVDITSKTKRAIGGPQAKASPPVKSRSGQAPRPFHGVAIRREYLVDGQATHGYVVKHPYPHQPFIAVVHRTVKPRPSGTACGYVVTELEPGQTPVAYVVEKRVPGQPLFGFVFPKKGQVSYVAPTKADITTRVGMRFKRPDPHSIFAKLAAKRQVLQMTDTPPQPDLATLRLEIAGDWTARDFAKAYAAIDRMYAALYHMQLNRPPIGRFNLSTVPPVAVDSVQYASPGDINLTGLGEPLKEIRESVKDMAGRHKRELEAQDSENALLEQKFRHNEENHDLSVMAQKIAMVQTWCEVMRTSNLPEAEIQDFVRRSMGSSLTDLQQLAREGKILDARTTPALKDDGGSGTAHDGTLEHDTHDPRRGN